ncbi:CSC1-like protein [Hibiscus syriacus]|uniref:CSC1-like protein n=1 Tax=Hibiscus syriacus TaxID=106335 RepID=A0A6A2Z480_HIBSY|nr:CSC1-like protein [Hibiscus syriacus]
MATLSDIGLAATINILSAFAFFLAFAILRIQPVNDRVYFPKWYIKGLRSSPLANGAFVSKFVNLDFRSYARFLNWMPAALQMPEPELIDHAGLDSAVYLRIYLLGLKIFVPIVFLAFTIMVPVNWTNNTLEHSGLTFSDIDKLSISNIPNGSERYWTHLVMAYAFTFWTCYMLKREYEIVAAMRLHFLASEQRRPDQFTVLVRNVPPDPDESVSELVEHFFLVNHSDHYLSHQVVYNANKLSGLVKEKKIINNWLDYYKNKYERNPSMRPLLKISAEREKITNNPKSIMPAAFVSFKTRWGAAVCAQTQQCRNPTIWLTEWAPEPRDVYWENLAIPFVFLTIRRLIAAVAFFFLTFFFMFPIAIVQSLANIESIEKALPFLKPIIQAIPKTIGASIPMKATFFITYIMVDGWAGVAAEILRLKPLIIYHLKNFFLVKTKKDREEAMDPGTIGFNTGEPQIQLYFLLGLVYAVVTPILLPFIIVFFGLAYVVYRHQIINVYNQEYESAAAFWPDVHLRIIVALIVSQLLLMGLLSTKEAASSTPLLITLPVLTIWFHRFCKKRYEPAFVRYPLQETMMKDTLERAREPYLSLKGFLQNAYMHPVFKSADDDDIDLAMRASWEEEPSLVATKRKSKRSTPFSSKHVGSSLFLPEANTEIKA